MEKIAFEVQVYSFLVATWAFIELLVFSWKGLRADFTIAYSCTN